MPFKGLFKIRLAQLITKFVCKKLYFLLLQIMNIFRKKNEPKRLRKQWLFLFVWFGLYLFSYLEIILVIFVLETLKSSLYAFAFNAETSVSRLM